jgi:RNA polymerase sigma-70 factor (ECF subfamily)
VSGDFESVWSQYQPGVLRFVRSGVADMETAEDLTSEAFTRALAAWGRFVDPGHGPLPWLYAIARNVVADHYKSAARRTQPVPDHTLRDRPAPVDVEAIVIVRVVIEQMLGELLRDHRRCLALRFMDDRGVPETAEIMGRRDGALKMMQARALASCRRTAALAEAG